MESILPQVIIIVALLTPLESNMNYIYKPNSRLRNVGSVYVCGNDVGYLPLAQGSCPQPLFQLQ